MIDTASLLSLPIELLQHISRYVPDETLLPLRQTCKELDAAVFDDFAAQYLKHIYCSFLEPERLDRLEQIVQTPHLAAQLHHVVLTLDPWEQRTARAIQTARKADEEEFEDQRSFWVEQPDAVKDENTPRAPDVGRLSQILNALKGLSVKLELDLNCREEPDYHWRYPYREDPACWENTCSAIIDAVHITSYPLHCLQYANDSITSSSAHQLEASVEHAGTLKILTFQFFDRNIRADSGYSQALDSSLASVMKVATHLEYLSVQTHSPQIDLSAILLRAPCFSTLHLMKLSSVEIKESILPGVFAKCVILHTLDLLCVTAVTTAAADWVNVLEAIQSLPALERLTVHSPRAVFGNISHLVYVPPAPHSDQREVEFLDICAQSRAETEAGIVAGIAGMRVVRRDYPEMLH